MQKDGKPIGTVIEEAATPGLKTLLRGLRPFFLWLCIAVAAWLYHIHAKWTKLTTLRFSVFLEGAATPDYDATLDGKRFTSGDNVSLGWHDLAVTHPKGESFSRRIFTWYGGNNAGNIAFSRAKGKMLVEAVPPVPELTIRGPQFSQVFKDLGQTNIVVPSDPYEVIAKYQYWTQSERITVEPASESRVHLAPPLGALRMTSSHSNSSLELRLEGGSQIFSDTLPAEVNGLPEGLYRALVTRKGSRHERAIEVKRGVTNNLQVEFSYGVVLVNSEPSGARVLNAEREDLGMTPLVLSEVPPGEAHLHLKLDGYEATTLTVTSVPKVTNSFGAKLVRVGYANAMQAARRYLQVKEFKRAFAAADEALTLSPSDTEASGIKSEAMCRESLNEAKSLAKAENYVAALEKLATAEKLLPDECAALRADYTKRWRSQESRREEEWKTRGDKAFGAILAQYDGADLFEKHELHTTKPLNQTVDEVISALTAIEPVFQVKSRAESSKDSVLIVGEFDFPLFSKHSGRREAIVQVTTISSNDTQLLFIVMDFLPGFDRPAGAPPGTVNYVPIHTSRGSVSQRLQNQVVEGNADIVMRMKRVAENR